MPKERLFSVTRADCEWNYYSGSGAGGQHRNKHRNCVRVFHKPSGARGNSQDHRDKLSNEKTAFERMAHSPEMQKWLRIEMARHTGALAAAEEATDIAMRPSNLLVQAKDENGKWVAWEDRHQDEPEIEI
jgi:protein subunit release factor B